MYWWCTGLSGKKRAGHTQNCPYLFLRSIHSWILGGHRIIVAMVKPVRNEKIPVKKCWISDPWCTAGSAVHVLTPTASRFLSTLSTIFLKEWHLCLHWAFTIIGGGLPGWELMPSTNMILSSKPLRYLATSRCVMCSNSVNCRFQSHSRPSILRSEREYSSSMIFEYNHPSGRKALRIRVRATQAFCDSVA